MFPKKLQYKIFLIVFFLIPSTCLALMSSNEYTIFADGFSSGGGVSSGGEYGLQDTIGESPVGSSVNGAYRIIAGYQAMSFGTLEVDFNTTTINLGTLAVGAVASSSVIVTVTTTAPGGYVLQTIGAGPSPITAVSDGSVTAGQEEYGISVSGPDAIFADDRAIPSITVLNLAASLAPVSNISTELIFKASITNATTAGDKSQSVFFNISANL